MRYYFYFSVLVSFLIFHAPGKSEATSFPITTFESASFSFGASGFGSFNFDAFEPNFQGFTWQIESAKISVTQNITLLVNTPPNFIFIPGPVPIPYSFRYRVSQDFFSTGSIFPDGFSTVVPRAKFFSGVASGSGGVTSLTKSFNYSFTFDSDSDLIGGLEFSGNGLFEAMREDFLPTQFSDKIFGSTDLDAAKIFGLNSSLLAFSGAGSLLIRYDGTLLLEEGQTPPEFLFSVPAVLPLPVLATGFAAICLIGWRRKQVA